jgi:hypothetical protein
MPTAEALLKPQVAHSGHIYRKNRKFIRTRRESHHDETLHAESQHSETQYSETQPESLVMSMASRSSLRSPVTKRLSVRLQTGASELVDPQPRSPPELQQSGDKTTRSGRASKTPGWLKDYDT